jgi:hypothetical protein
MILVGSNMAESLLHLLNKIERAAQHMILFKCQSRKGKSVGTEQLPRAWGGVEELVTLNVQDNYWGLC